MKKFINSAVIYSMVLGAMVCLSLSSCSKNDDSSSTDSYGGADVILISNFSEDFLKLFDVTFTVTDFENNTTTITAEAGDKTYTFSTSSKTASAKVTYKCAMKSDVTADGNTYLLSRSCYIIYRTKTNSGNTSEAYEVTPTAGSTTVTVPLTTDENISTLKYAFNVTQSYTFVLSGGKFLESSEAKKI